MKTMKRWGLEGRIVSLRNKGLSYREIGERLGVTGNYVMALYKRSKKHHEKPKPKN